MPSADTTPPNPARFLSAEAFVVASVLLASAGQLGMKLALAGQAHTHVGIFGPAWIHLWSAPVQGILTPLHLPAGIAGSLCLYGLGTLLWVRAIGMKALSYLYPLASLNYILVALGAHLLLGEPVNLVRWAGLCLMVAGIVLLTRTASEQSPNPVPISANASVQGVTP